MVKSAGFDSSVFEGTARVFDGERAAMDALEDGTITAAEIKTSFLATALGGRASTLV